MQAASEHTARLLRENWLRVTEQVAEACMRANRVADSVRIVAASKYVQPDIAWQLFQAGCQLFGENRPQALWDKVSYFQQQRTSAAAVQWHLIGHLQRNKIKRTLPLIHLLHSLDSLRLAAALSQEAQHLECQLPVLLEVNVTEDNTKTGLAPEQLIEIIGDVAQLPGLQVRGLMAMSSLAGGADTARREFDRVRALRDECQQQLGSVVNLCELSMGMSGDFREAIAAGATLVRIGSSLWEGLA